MTDALVETNRSPGTAFAELVRTLVDDGRPEAAAAAYLREDWVSGVIALLRAARREAGLTQGEIADRLGTTQSAVARLERGDDAKLSRVWDYLWACGKTPLTVDTTAGARLRRYVAEQPSAPRSASAVDRWIAGREAALHSVAPSPPGSPSVGRLGIDPSREGSLSAAATGVDWSRLHSLSAAISEMDWSGIGASADAIAASTAGIASFMVVPHLGGQTLGQVVRAALNAGYRPPSGGETSDAEPASEGSNAVGALAGQVGGGAASSWQPAKPNDALAAGQGFGPQWGQQQDRGNGLRSTPLRRNRLPQAAA